MSTNEDPARLIAERVARRLSSGATDRGESQPSNGAERAAEKPSARVINFVSATPPAPVRSSTGAPTEPAAPQISSPSPAAQSPWLAPFVRSEQNQAALHPSEERFGVEEAAVSELVEFFENEKQCTVDPS